jgi:hypothetical protein
MLWTRMHWREVLETAATIAVAVVWFAALRPVALGGPASYIVVHGYSMSGALAPGDLVVTMAQHSYSAGDPIVYRVSYGAGRGLLVVHRIISADPSGYRMQGDANSYVDPWRPKASDVVGRIVVTLPGAGTFLSSLANPFVLAAVWGLVALVLGLSFLPDPPEGKSDPSSKPTSRKGPHPGLDGALRNRRPRIRTRAAHPLLSATTGWAVGIMVALVMVGGASTLLPAYAAGLKTQSAALTAQVHVSLPYVAVMRPGPGPRTGPAATTPGSWQPARPVIGKRS